MRSTRSMLAAALFASLCSCGEDGATGPEGPAGPAGPQGPAGQDGDDGQNGASGDDGEDGEDGEDGQNGASCPTGGGFETEVEGVSSTAPLSSMVSLTFCDAANTGATNIPDYVKALVVRYGNSTMPTGIHFPLSPAATDSVRAISGLVPDVVVKWLDPLTWDNMSGPTTTPRFGANADFMAFFGDGWQTPGTPFWQGSDDAGWVWVNHEYVSNDRPRATAAPTGQHLTLAKSDGHRR